jgi:hypothetical protein
MDWTYWADLLNIKLSLNILLGARSRCCLKNEHVQKADSVFDIIHVINMQVATRAVTYKAKKLKLKMMQKKKS